MGRQRELERRRESPHDFSACVMNWSYMIFLINGRGKKAQYHFQQAVEMFTSAILQLKCSRSLGVDLIWRCLDKISRRLDGIALAHIR